jgi:hypothetical protein
MTARTRSLVAAATPYRPLITLDMVATETPASRATSTIVARAAFWGWSAVVTALTLSDVTPCDDHYEIVIDND